MFGQIGPAHETIVGRKTSRPATQNPHHVLLLLLGESLAQLDALQPTWFMARPVRRPCSRADEFLPLAAGPDRRNNNTDINPR